MATDDNAVAAILDLITSLEKEAADAKRTLNRMLVRAGQPPRFTDAELNTDHVNGVGKFRNDLFYLKPLAPSIREFLQMRHAANQGPGSLNDIYDALVRGGFKFETENEDNRKRNLRQSLTKNTAMFHRLSNGNYGLIEWYPNLRPDDGAEAATATKKKKKPKRAAAAAKPAPAKPSAKAPKTPAPAAPDLAGTDTLLGTVRAAIMAMPGEFTKQDVVDWITANFPERKAEDKKTSIFSMVARLKDELNLKTAFAGKGKEPFRYKREDK